MPRSSHRRLKRQQSRYLSDRGRSGRRMKRSSRKRTSIRKKERTSLFRGSETYELEKSFLIELVKDQAGIFIQTYDNAMRALDGYYVKTINNETITNLESAKRILDDERTQTLRFTVHKKPRFEFTNNKFLTSNKPLDAPHMHSHLLDWKRLKFVVGSDKDSYTIELQKKFGLVLGNDLVIESYNNPNRQDLQQVLPGQKVIQVGDDIVTSGTKAIKAIKQASGNTISITVENNPTH